MQLEGREDEAVRGQLSGRAVQNGPACGLGSLPDQPGAHGPAFGVLVIERRLPLLRRGKEERSPQVNLGTRPRPRSVPGTWQDPKKKSVRCIRPKF